MERGDLRSMFANPATLEDLHAILTAPSASYARAELRFDTSAQDLDAPLDLVIKECPALLRRGKA